MQYLKESSITSCFLHQKSSCIKRKYVFLSFVGKGFCKWIYNSKNKTIKTLHKFFTFPQRIQKIIYTVIGTFYKIQTLRLVGKQIYTLPFALEREKEVDARYSSYFMQYIAYITAVVFTFVFSEYSPSSLSRYINREKRERGPSKWDIVRSSVLLTFVSRKFLSTSEFTIAYKKNFLVPQKHNSNITDIHGIFKL